MDLPGLGVLLAAIGAINRGLIGLFGFDPVAAITTAGKFGETTSSPRLSMLSSV